MVRRANTSDFRGAKEKATCEWVLGKVGVEVDWEGASESESQQGWTTSWTPAGGEADADILQVKESRDSFKGEI